MPDTYYSCRLCTFGSTVEKAVVEHAKFHHDDVTDDPEDVVIEEGS